MGLAVTSVGYLCFALCAPLRIHPFWRTAQYWRDFGEKIEKVMQNDAF